MLGTLTDEDLKKGAHKGACEFRRRKSCTIVQKLQVTQELRTLHMCDYRRGALGGAARCILNQGGGRSRVI